MNFSINQNAPFIRTPPFFSADIDLVQMDSLYIRPSRNRLLRTLYIVLGGKITKCRSTKI